MKVELKYNIPGIDYIRDINFLTDLFVKQDDIGKCISYWSNRDITELFKVRCGGVSRDPDDWTYDFSSKGLEISYPIFNYFKNKDAFLSIQFIFNKYRKQLRKKLSFWTRIFSNETF